MLHSHIYLHPCKPAYMTGIHDDIIELSTSIIYINPSARTYDKRHRKYHIEEHTSTEILKFATPEI